MVAREWLSQVMIFCTKNNSGGKIVPGTDRVCAKALR